MEEEFVGSFGQAQPGNELIESQTKSKQSRMDKFNKLVKTIFSEYRSNGGFLVSTLTILSLKVLMVGGT